MQALDRAELLYASWAKDFEAAFKEDAPSFDEASQFARFHFFALGSVLTDEDVERRVADESICRAMSVGSVDPMRYALFHTDSVCPRGAAPPTDQAVGFP